MKVDFHFHLEEGPYSYRWLQRTAIALEAAVPSAGEKSCEHHTLPWIINMVDRLHDRLAKGCFTEEWLSAYLRLGRERGIEKFGVVDHLYRFTEFRPYYERHMLLDDSEIGKLQRKWLDSVCIGSIRDFIRPVRMLQESGAPLALGVEADYFEGGEAELKELLSEYDLDYVIGSVHFVDGWGFDNPDTQHYFERHDLMELYRRFFGLVKKAASSGLFDIIAHPDNLKVFNYRPEESKLVNLYDEVARTLKEADVASEINTGLAYRYPVKEMCPSPLFLKKLFEHGVPITLSSDSHFPDDIGTMLDEAVQLAKDAGYEEVVCYQNRRRFAVSLLD
jgi:Histidinol phosphatase and related hydrolases of the PHP family